MARRFLLIPILLSGLAASDRGAILDRNYREWTQAEAVWVLNKSPFARRETFTRVVEGVGSGVRGEKELLSTYFVRFLSARPVREAYVRLLQLENGYGEMSDPQRESFDQGTARLLDLDCGSWIVIAMAFRSNEPDQELRFKRHYQVQTLETLRRTTSLSTKAFSKLEPVAYFPPEEDGVGARFVFPRRLEGVDVISPRDEFVTFESEVPVATPRLRSQFRIRQMIRGEELDF